MKMILLFLFIMDLNLYANNGIVVNITEVENPADSAVYFSTHSFGLVCKTELKNIITYCLLAINQIPASDLFKLSKNPKIEINAFSTTGASYDEIARAVLHELEIRYLLSFHEKSEMQEIIVIDSIPNDLKDSENGGTNFDGKGNVEIRNMTILGFKILYNKNFFLQQNFYISNQQKISIKKIPLDCINNYQERKKELIEIFQKNGISCHLENKHVVIALN